MTSRRAVAAALGCLALTTLTGCGGGGGQAAAVRSAFARYAGAMAHGDAATACRQITPTYWNAILVELDAAYEAQGAGRFPVRSCRAGLAHIFTANGGSPFAGAGYALTSVSVHGASARAIETRGGVAGAQLRFVRSGQTWRLDCCTGSQNDRQARVRYRVPSPAMSPTLRPGQIITADNTVLTHRPPALYDVVTLHPPAGADGPSPHCGTPHEGAGQRMPCGRPAGGESAQIFIKRIVGVPGDRIAVRGGAVIRNGHREPAGTITCTDAAACDFPQAITVPAGEYFVMGDNRAASDDSRFWGPVKRAWLIGVVTGLPARPGQPLA